MLQKKKKYRDHTYSGSFGTEKITFVAFKTKFCYKRNNFGAEKIEFCSRKNTFLASGQFFRKKKKILQIKIFPSRLIFF